LDDAFSKLLTEPLRLFKSDIFSFDSTELIFIFHLPNEWTQSAVKALKQSLTAGDSGFAG
jgi:hypothetical protein